MSQKTTTERGQGTAQEGRAALPANTNWKLRWGAYMLLGTAILFLIQGVGMIYRAVIARTYELGVNELGGHTATELAQSNPAVQSYIDHLAVNLGGLMTAAGIAMGALVWYGVRSGYLWALVSAILIPILYAVIGLPIHQTVHFHFDQLVHLGPAGVGIPLLVAGTILAYQGIQAVSPVANSTADTP